MLRRNLLVVGILLARATAARALAGSEQDRKPEPETMRARMAARQGSLAAVDRGERVSVEVSSGAARLAFEAMAESGGRVGSVVLVRNPANGHVFQAKVAEKGKVVVQK